MHFERVLSILDGARPLSERLVAELSAGKQVLWLVPGGSNIPLSVEVSRLIPEELTKNLTVMLTDERYGEVGHKDSNTIQLETAGFHAGRSMFHAVLQQGLSLEQTTERYARDFAAAASHADVLIGQFGMGSDGHMAGMLPGSGAVNSADLTFGYQAPGYVRITLTPRAIIQIHAAYVFAFGEEKLQALSNLHDKNLSLDEQPAQIIKQLPESYVYNDQIG